MKSIIAHVFIGCLYNYDWPCETSLLPRGHAQIGTRDILGVFFTNAFLECQPFKEDIIDWPPRTARASFFKPDSRNSSLELDTMRALHQRSMSTPKLQNSHAIKAPFHRVLRILLLIRVIIIIAHPLVHLKFWAELGIWSNHVSYFKFGRFGDHFQKFVIPILRCVKVS